MIKATWKLDSRAVDTHARLSEITSGSFFFFFFTGCKKKKRRRALTTCCTPNILELRQPDCTQATEGRMDGWLVGWVDEWMKGWRGGLHRASTLLPTSHRTHLAVWGPSALPTAHWFILAWYNNQLEPQWSATVDSALCHALAPYEVKHLRLPVSPAALCLCCAAPLFNVWTGA